MLSSRRDWDGEAASDEEIGRGSVGIARHRFISLSTERTEKTCRVLMVLGFQYKVLHCSDAEAGDRYHIFTGFHMWLGKLVQS